MRPIHLIDNGLNDAGSPTHWGQDKMTVISQMIFWMHFLEWNVWISIKISLKFVPITNIPTLVQIMAWPRRGDKPSSGLTHWCLNKMATYSNAFWLVHTITWTSGEQVLRCHMTGQYRHYLKKWWASSTMSYDRPVHTFTWRSDKQVLQRYMASLGLKSWSAEGTCKKILWGIFKNTVWSEMLYLS